MPVVEVHLQHSTMAQWQWCVAVLVLQVWGSASADPSEALGGVDRAVGQIVDRNALLNGCPELSRPDTMPSAAGLAGDWCGLQNVDVVQNATGTSAECRRTTFDASGDQLRLIYRNVKDTGEVTVTINVTLSRLPNEAWLIRYGNRITNGFIGFKNERLVMCYTKVEGDAIIENEPEKTYSAAYKRCLLPHQDPAEHRDVARCDLPGERT